MAGAADRRRGRWADRPARGERCRLPTAGDGRDRGRTARVVIARTSAREPSRCPREHRGRLDAVHPGGGDEGRGDVVVPCAEQDGVLELEAGDADEVGRRPHEFDAGPARGHRHDRAIAPRGQVVESHARIDVRDDEGRAVPRLGQCDVVPLRRLEIRRPSRQRRNDARAEHLGPLLGIPPRHPASCGADAARQGEVDDLLATPPRRSSDAASITA